MRMVRKIYLDTNVLIDLTEGYDETRLPVDGLIAEGMAVVLHLSPAP